MSNQLNINFSKGGKNVKTNLGTTFSSHSKTSFLWRQGFSSQSTYCSFKICSERIMSIAGFFSDSFRCRDVCFVTECLVFEDFTISVHSFAEFRDLINHDVKL